MNLLPNKSMEQKGDHIRRLQDLMREEGTYTKSLTGVYDGETLLAVKKFQSSKGIEQDGIVGGQTLMHLYHSIGHFNAPALRGDQK